MVCVFGCLDGVRGVCVVFVCVGGVWCTCIRGV